MSALVDRGGSRAEQWSSLVEVSSQPDRRPPPAVTRRFRGPFARWPRTADATLALLHGVFVTFFTDGPGDSLVLRDLGRVPLAVLAVFVAASASLYWRRTHPLQVVGVGALSMVVLLGSGYADTGGAALFGLYATGRYTDADLAGRLAVALVSVVFVADGFTDNLVWGEVVFAVVVAVGSWLFGRSRRLQHEAADRWLREQEAERRRVVAEERTRIARELHDVVAHRVSIMTVQAGAAATVADVDPVAARRAMQAVEDAGRQALDELRHLLGVLRPEHDGAELGPQPGIDDLPRLVDRVRAAGPSVAFAVAEELRADGPAGAPPAHVQLSAHRIVQEALTNVLKHVGGDATVTVDLRRVDDVLVIEVADDGGARPHHPRPRSLVSAGHGIIGMRERAMLLGGELEVGATPDGGFRVRALLPLAPSLAPTPGHASPGGAGAAAPGAATPSRTAAGEDAAGRVSAGHDGSARGERS